MMMDEPCITRPCPHCGKPMNAPATLCGYCWTRVVPLGPDGNTLASYVPPEAHRPWWKLWG
jgi:hypothetical protein